MPVIISEKPDLTKIPENFTGGLIICGPTASGKTGLSIEAALKFNGEIVSADSMQLYRYMDIGTAKPTAEERRGIPHHMIDIIDPKDEYSVVQYAENARIIIKDIISRGKTPVIVGGTGQYINAIYQNIQFDTTVPDEELVNEVHEFYLKNGTSALHRLLSELDPNAADAIHENNLKRVERAIVMFRSTGLTLDERNARSRDNSAKSGINYTLYYINPPRDELYGKIDRRVDIMMASGLEDEVRRVRELGMGHTASQAIGYKEIIDAFDGTVSLSEAVDAIKQGSRNYAKRQYTWFKKTCS